MKRDPKSQKRASNKPGKSIQSSYALPSEDFQIIETLINRCEGVIEKMSNNQILRIGIHQIKNFNAEDIAASLKEIGRNSAGRPPRISKKLFHKPTKKARSAKLTFSEITDEQWELVNEVFARAKHTKTNYRANERQLLNGILYIMLTGEAWNNLPSDYGSGSTCWRRYNHLIKSGLWNKVWLTLINTLNENQKKEWATAVFSGNLVPIKDISRQNPS